jgi:tetratricopeptide (TPR) repeat protein
LMYLSYLTTAKIKFLILAFVFFVSSCLSKSAAVVLPLVLFLIDYSKDRKFNLKTMMEKIPFLIISLVFGIVAMYSQKNSIQEMAPSMSMIEHISIVCFSLFSYLYKAIIPVGLSAVYTYPIQLGSSLPFLYYLSIVAIGILCLFIWYSRKWGKDVMFGSIFFLITILLVLQILPVGAAMMADRYTYIPYIGLFFILAKFIAPSASQVKHKFQLISFLMIVALFAWFSWLTYNRVKVWEDEGKLFTDVIDKYPNSYISYQGRGFYYVQSVTNSSYAGSNENKIALINKGIDDYYVALKYALKADQKVSSYNNIGYAKYTLGDLKGAIQAFDHAITNDTNCTSAYLNRGFANAGLNQFQQALDDFNKVIRLNPLDSNAIKNRDIVLSLLNETKGKE